MVGQGNATQTADATARLLASLLEIGQPDLPSARVNLDNALGNVAANTSVSSVEGRLHACGQIAQFFNSSSNVRYLRGLGAPDVRFDNGGVTRFVEVKAQYKKAQLSHIVQADWVRDITDGLRFLAHSDATLRAPQFRSIAQIRTTPALTGWTWQELWASDVALLTSAGHKHAAGVASPNDLQQYLSRKWLLHLTEQGVREIRLSSIAPLLDFGALSYRIKLNLHSEVAIQIFHRAIKRPIFTYHVYPPGYKGLAGTIGRHKAHARLFP